MRTYKHASQKTKGPAVKPVLHYIIAAAAVLLFALIYDHYSHGVHSLFMDLAFLIPLAGGLLVWLGSRGIPICAPGITGAAGDAARRLVTARRSLAAGIITLTAGSIMEGIFLIAGTSSRYIIAYPAAGAVLLAIAAVYRLRAGTASSRLDPSAAVRIPGPAPRRPSDPDTAAPLPCPHR